METLDTPLKIALKKMINSSRERIVRQNWILIAWLKKVKKPFQTCKLFKNQISSQISSQLSTLSSGETKEHLHKLFSYVD